MTITNYDSFALLPTRCDKCNRLFIFEPYDTFAKYTGIPTVDCFVKCKKCKGR